MRLSIFALILAVSLPVNAAPPLPVSPVMSRLKFAAGDTLCTSSSCKVLNAVAANAAEGSRTFTLSVTGYSKATIQLDFVWAAATDHRLACSGSVNGGGSYARITSTAITAGVGTISLYQDVRAVGASENILLEYDVRTYDKIRCVWSTTGGGASDNITAYAEAAVGY